MNKLKILTKNVKFGKKWKNLAIIFHSETKKSHFFFLIQRNIFQLFLKENCHYFLKKTTYCILIFALKFFLIEARKKGKKWTVFHIFWVYNITFENCKVKSLKSWQFFTNTSFLFAKFRNFWKIGQKMSKNFFWNFLQSKRNQIFLFLL